jgi:CubicO group peptidase (beta-lactamase class C family)
MYKYLYTNSYVDIASFLDEINKENGKIIYDKAFGIANFETKEPLKTSSAFQLASISKQFTAMAIMILKEHGKLNYDDTISMYIPEIPKSRALTSWNGLTEKYIVMCGKKMLLQ